MSTSKLLLSDSKRFLEPELKNPFYGPFARFDKEHFPQFQEIFHSKNEFNDSIEQIQIEDDHGYDENKEDGNFEYLNI